MTRPLRYSNCTANQNPSRNSQFAKQYSRFAIQIQAWNFILMGARPLVLSQGRFYYNITMSIGTFLTPSRRVYYFFPVLPAGLFSVKIQKKFLAITNFSVNDTMSGQPNKRLIH